MDHNQQTEWTSLLTGEMLLFRLLGQVLYTEPEWNQLQALFDQDVFSESPFGADQTEVRRGLTLLQGWGRQAFEHPKEETLKALRDDYLQLFIGLDWVQAPPWESVYFSERRLLFQEQTLQVRDWYLKYNLLPEHLNNEPDDHISLEMAFLSHLAKLGLDALDRQDQQAFDELLQAQRDFASRHFLRWVPMWCDLTEKDARTDFYRGLACLVRGAMLELSTQLEAEIRVEEAPWMQASSE
jgi:TorA maturation chaperone TorD